MALERVEPMEGWTLLADAARELGISRQTMHDAVDDGRVTTARYLGETRRVYAIRTAELATLRGSFSASHQERGRRNVRG